MGNEGGKVTCDTNSLLATPPQGFPVTGEERMGLIVTLQQKIKPIIQ